MDLGVSYSGKPYCELLFGSSIFFSNSAPCWCWNAILDRLSSDRMEKSMELNGGYNGKIIHNCHVFFWGQILFWHRKVIQIIHNHPNSILTRNKSRMPIVDCLTYSEWPLLRLRILASLASFQDGVDASIWTLVGFVWLRPTHPCLSFYNMRAHIECVLY